MNLLVFPNQLYQQHPGFELKPKTVFLLEDSLFFGDDRYPAKFHKQKLWLHRSTMQHYQKSLEDRGLQVRYLKYDGRRLGARLAELATKKTGKQFAVCDPTDFILERRLLNAAESLDLRINFLPNPGFLNTGSENQEYRECKKRWFMADFYKWQRKRMDLLMDGDQPQGGQWSFDEKNRKKVPKNKLDSIPAIPKLRHDELDQQAQQSVLEDFPDHPGELGSLYYPTTHAAAKRWLKQFLKTRFDDFGVYEDAIVGGESWLWHSVLTPMLNVGLLTPKQIIDETMKYADKNDVPLNSLEGFIRQVIGWREFMRATYEDLGVTMRNGNHWQHDRDLPDAFYDGTTGILPIDDTIQRILQTGYCHHIERLMVLGGFLFLCEIHPKAIYRWFMEMFVDSYDWVMVPNVYAMSQHADGGLITTKPYFSGSSYVRKMSHYKKGDWCDIWDGLYWRWIWNHVDELAKNPRWAMMCATAKKMDAKKRDAHLAHAEEFLARW